MYPTELRSKISIDKIPYDLPKTWKWEKIAKLSISIEYGTSQKTNDDLSKVPVYRMGNILHGKLLDINLKYIDENIDDLPRLYLQENDILFNRTNSYELVGKTAIYQGKNNITTFASYLIRIRLFKKYIFPLYINMAMNSPYFRKTQIEPEIVQQCGQANFNGTKLSETLIPIAPLAEQYRIIAKVDQLMKMCDQLEQQIEQSTDKRTKLLNAILSNIQ